MNLFQFVIKLPEVGNELIAKAKRVEDLRQEARYLEEEVWAKLNAMWSEKEIKSAKRGLE